MRSTIDGAGRVVVPKPMRARLGLIGAAEIEIEEHDGVVEIRPRTREAVVMEEADGRLSLDAPDGTPPMTDEDVRAITEATRQWPRG